MLLYYFSRGINRLMTKLKYNRHKSGGYQPVKSPRNEYALERMYMRMIMPLGQYKGYAYEKLPRHYLDWAAQNITKPYIQFLLQAEVKRRSKYNLT